MHYSFLKQLICPYCGSDLKVEFAVHQNKTELVNGILKCDCSEFPVLNGILIFNFDSLNDLVIELLKNKKIEKAISICLGFDYFKRIQVEKTTSLVLPFPHQLSDIMRYFLSSLAEITVKKKFGRLYEQFSDKNIPFVNLLGNSFFDKYLKHRFSADSFWSLYPFLTIIDKKKMRILDLGCGAGHLSFVLSEYIKPFELCCADKCFNLLYLAKKYFASKADFVCLDFDIALPFKNRTFSSIIMSDALFLVKSRFSFVHEIERLLMEDCLSLFLHVHNSLGNNLAPIGSRNETMNPGAWKDLFKRIKLRTIMLTETKVLDDFLFQNTLELQSEFTEAELNSGKALIFLATSDKSLLRNYTDVKSILLSKKNNLIINPIYRIVQEGNKIILYRPSLNPTTIGDFYPIANKYIPKKIELSRDLAINKSINSSDVKYIEELIGSFVLLNVPENYV